VSAYREPEEAPLGERVGEFRTAKTAARVRIGLGGALTTVGLLTDVLAVTAGHAAFGVVAVLGALFPAAGVAMLVSSYRDRGHRFEAYEDGLVEHRGGKTRRLRWEDVVSVTSDLRPRDRRNPQAVAPNQRHTIRARTGHELVFTDAIANCNFLLALVREKTLRHLLPWAQAQIDAGEVIEFGEFRASRAGISTEYQSIGWAQIEGTDVVDDFEVVIKGRGSTWMETRMVNVPNMHVLFALVDRMREPAEGTAE
jgi:hypothetical protein